MHMKLSGTSAVPNSSKPEAKANRAFDSFSIATVLFMGSSGGVLASQVTSTVPGVRGNSLLSLIIVIVGALIGGFATINSTLITKR